jgi:hypothetical protein
MTPHQIDSVIVAHAEPLSELYSKNPTLGTIVILLVMAWFFIILNKAINKS